MWQSIHLFIGCLALKVVCSQGVKNLTIGYLTADRTTHFVRDKQGRIVSGAIAYAVEQINNDSSLLPGHRLNMIWSDTEDETLVGIARLTEQWREGAVAFFGPEETCAVEARVAAAWNLPMLSYKCADYEVSDKDLYPTFARTFPPATQVTKSIISLLRKFNWSRFTLVVGSSHKQQTCAEKLLELAEENNITLNERVDYQEPHIPLTTGNPFPGIVDRTYIDTRLYVFLGEVNGMVDLMTNMYDRGLLDTGEYIVIFVDHGTFDPSDPLKYFKRTVDPPDEARNADGARSLLVISSSPPSNSLYSEFHEKVNDYNEEPPFNFPNPFDIDKKITVYAAHLYDAVFLYARSLDKVIKEGGYITNGKAIVDKILGTSYMSIQGFLCYIDDNGDAEGNYTVLARVEENGPASKYAMGAIGHFEINSHKFAYLAGKSISWISGEPPIDEPPCGYRGQRCIPPKSFTLEIIVGVIGGIVFVAGVIALVAYRNWRYEQEIAGLLWMIHFEHIHTKNLESHTPQPRKRTGSWVSHTSFDSRNSFTQVYAKTGTYRGQIVALKIFDKKHLEVTRRVKKEMKMMRDLRHDNINAFSGACIDAPYFIAVTEYCAKGSLQDILENDDIKLDSMFVASLVKDLIQGMIYLHDSELGHHGNLKSSNCVVNSRWALQVTDYGLLDIRATSYSTEDEHAFYRNMLWRAPEQLRDNTTMSSQKGDIYGLGIILYEIFGREGPYGDCWLSPKEIIGRVAAISNEPFRPDMTPLDCEAYITDCISACWSEVPEERPDFRTVWNRLKPLRSGMKRSIFDNMIAMMEKYQSNLEQLVDERTGQLNDEKKKTEALLHRMLPKSVADLLKRGEPVLPEEYRCVTIYFSDICGFTKLAAESTPLQVVDLLNDLYTVFDSTIRHYDVYKVETIGDAYMVVSGLPEENGDNHAGEIASMSIHLLRAIKTFKMRHNPDYTLKLRIGIHSGSCVSGVVGLTMPRYCLFGDTVNTSSRMESNGEALKIHCSGECKSLLDKLGGYELVERGLVPMKGKGELLTYWLLDEDPTIRQDRLAKSENNNLLSILPNMSSVADEPLRKILTNKKLKMIESPRSSKRNLAEDKESSNFLDIIRVPEGRIPNGDSPVSHRRSGTFTEPSSRLRSGVRNSLSGRIKSDIQISNDAKYIMPDSSSPKCKNVPSPFSKQVFDYPSEKDRLLQMDVTFKECNPLNIHSCKFQYTPNGGRKGGDDTELGIWEEQTTPNATNSTYDDQIITT